MASIPALLLAALLAGCTDPMIDPGSSSSPLCPLPPVNLSGTVERVDPNSMLVNATGSIEGPVVLHVRAGETMLYLRDGLSCEAATLSQVRVGDHFEAVANGPVMESYPPQTTPSHIFVDRPT